MLQSLSTTIIVGTEKLPTNSRNGKNCHFQWQISGTLYTLKYMLDLKKTKTKKKNPKYELTQWISLLPYMLPSYIVDITIVV